MTTKPRTDIRMIRSSCNIRSPEVAMEAKSRAAKAFFSEHFNRGATSIMLPMSSIGDFCNAAESAGLIVRDSGSAIC